MERDWRRTDMTFLRMKVSEMRQEEMARARARAAEIEEIRERAALAERLLHADECDEAAMAPVRAFLASLKQEQLLAEWEWSALGGSGPCMRIAPWKGKGYNGD